MAGEVVSRFVNPSVSVMHGQDGSLTLTLRPSLDEADTIVAVFGPLQVEDLALTLTREAMYAMSSALHQALAGSCATCNNYRLVDRPRHGRPWHEHCPDCGGDRAAKMRAVVPVLAESTDAVGGRP